VCRERAEREAWGARWRDFSVVSARGRCARQGSACRIGLVWPSLSGKGHAGAKSLSKAFNNAWMLDQGLLQRSHAGDLRDLVTRRFAERAAMIVEDLGALLGD
jgi:hypothetical protein